MLSKLPVFGVVAFLLLGVWVVGSKIFAGDASKGAVAAVTVPNLSPAATKGGKVFADNCAACHGDNGAGSDKGPPLINAIYNPGHHSDQSIRLAVKNGVRSHHWPYGAMPPQRQVTAPQVETVIAYIREIQVANGITYQAHRM